MEQLDRIDRQLLHLVQAHFPLEPEPYQKLGQMLGVGEGEVLDRLARLRNEGLIRRLGPVFNSRALGYYGMLCALQVEPDRVDEVAAYINAIPGVTHNYLREHRFNMWFTLQAENQAALMEILRQIREKTGIKEIMELPAEEVFKIKVNFET